MMSPIASGVILAYAAIVIAGGFVAWRLSGSRISLTAGLASAGLLAIAHRIGRSYPLVGHVLALLTAMGLLVISIVRFRDSRNPLPAGLMAFVSAVVFAILGWLTAGRL
jgi:uncharacterized membrane protein (UPF0136 family)